MTKAFITDRIYIKKKYLDEDVLFSKYVHASYNEAMCAKCPYFDERHGDECDECEHFLGALQLYSEKKNDKGQRIIGLPPGDIDQVCEDFDLDPDDIDDRRPRIKMGRKINFIGKLYTGDMVDGRKTPDQVGAAEAWRIDKSGIIVSPPRSGKTVMATNIICKTGVKTIVITGKIDLLRQFRETFLGGGVRRKQMTDATEDQVVIIDSMKDLKKNPDVALVTYKKFIRATANKRIKKLINDKYSLVVIDEAHNAGADAYASFLSKLNCRYRLAITATLNRKDGRHIVVKKFIGPVAKRLKVSAMIPTISLWETGCKPAKDFRSWPYMLNWLARNQQRNKMIVDRLFEKMREGHKACIVPLERVKHVSVLVDMINKRTEELNEQGDEEWPENIAVGLVGKSKRDVIFKDMDEGKHRVLVAMRQIIKEGVDLAEPSYLLATSPMSASHDKSTGAPMFYQLSTRVSTFMAGKRAPHVELMLDWTGAALGCFKSLLWKEIVPGTKNSKNSDAKYIINPKHRDRMFEIGKIWDVKKYTPPPEILNKKKGKAKAKKGPIKRF